MQMFGHNYSKKGLRYILLFLFLGVFGGSGVVIGQGLSVNSCPSINKRSNGNGGASGAAGDFRPTYSQNNPVAANVNGTPYQKVPYNPTTKTGNITFLWATNVAPVNLPVITRVWITSTSNVTSLSAIKFGPPPPPSLLAPGKYIANYCFYNQNMPPAGKVTLEFTDPVTGLVAFTCTYSLDKNAPASKPPTNCTPTVVSDPAAVATACGTNTTVTFTASATGAASIVWQKSTDKGVNWVNLTLPSGDYSAISASGTTTLTVANSLSHDGEWYRVNFVGSTNCGNAFTKPASLTSKPNPTASIVNTTSYCGINQQINIPVTLTGTAPWTISYTRTTSLGSTPVTVTTSLNPYIISDTPTAATTYTLTSVKDQFCTAPTPAANHIFNVYEVPTITLGANPTVCFGTTAISLPFSAPSGSPNQYSIATGVRAMPAFTAVSNASLGTSPIAITIPAGTAAGTYDFNLTVKNSTNGCTSTVYPFTITVNAPPYITASSTAATICSGGTAVLFASPSFNSFTWRVKGTPTVISTLASPSFSPTSTTTYEVTGTDATGCTAIAETTVTVNPPPVVTVTPVSGTICEGGSLILAASGGVSYTWALANNPAAFTGLSASQGAAVVASPTTTTAYEVTATSAQGCTAKATATVTVNTINMTLTPNTTVCSGNSATLVANITNSGTPTYSWYPFTGLFTDQACTIAYTGTSLGTVYAKPSSTTTYYVKGTINSCEETQSTQVTIEQAPVDISNSTGSSYIFCSSAISPSTGFTIPVTLTTAPISAVWSYLNTTTGLWINLPIGSTSLGNNVATFNVSSSPTSLTQNLGVSGYNNGNYGGPQFLRLTIQTSLCSYVYPITLIDLKGQGSITPSISVDRSTICSGESAVLTIGGLGSVTAQWLSSDNGSTFTPISGAISASLSTGTLTSNKYFSVELTASTSCKSTIAPQLITVVTPPVNTISPTEICSNNSSTITLTGTTATNATYLWEKSTNNINFTPIIGATSADYTLPFNTVPVTTYYRRIMSLGTCVVTSASTSIYAPITNDFINTTTSTFCDTAPQITLTGSNVSGGTGTYTYQWQVGTARESYSNIANATSKDYLTPGGETSDRWYKRITQIAGTSATTCTTLISESEIFIKVNPGGTITISPSSATICSGESTTLTASSSSDPLNYSWSPAVGLNSTRGFKVVATPATTTTYTVTGLTNQGCSITKTVTITVNTSPAAPTLANSSATICNLDSNSGNNSFNLTTLSNTTTTDWYLVPERNSNYLVPTPLTVNTPGKYYALSKSTTGGTTCYSSSFSTFTLAVDDVSKPTVLANNYTGCSNTDLTLLQPAQRTGVEYRWHTVSSSPASGNLVSPPTSVGSGTYYLYAYSTVGNCYGPASDPVTVTVISTITATVSSTSVSVCSPETVDLTTLNSTGGTSSFQWYTQNTPDPAKLVAFPNVVSEAGTYYLIPITNGCVGTASQGVVVSINPKPEVSISEPGLICSSTSPVSLSATITNTVTSPTYQWESSTDGGTWTTLSNGGVYSGVTTATLGISNPTGLGGTFYRCVVSAAGCSTTSDPEVLTIEPVPTFALLSTDVTVGLGGTATFEATLTNDGTSTIQWQISTNGGTSFTDLTEQAPYSGVNTTILTVANAIASQDGYVFRLKATNSCTDYFSPNAVLNVLTNPSWEITKVVSASNYSAVGDVLSYTIALENTGDVNIGNISITDPDADAPGAVRGQDITGDNDAALEPGEKWSYAASHTITQADITAGKFTNNATASGTPSTGSLPNKSASATSCAVPVITGTLNACVGGTTILSSSGIPAASGAWTSSNTAVASVNSSGVVTGVTQGTATITFNTLYGCSASVSVTINPLPSAPSFTITQPTCTTGTGSIVISGIQGFQYSIDGSTYSSTTTYSNLSPGTYSVTAKNTNGCVSSGAIALISNPPGAPVAPTFTASATTICSGTDATFTVSNGNANQTYQWLRDGSEVTGATGQTLVTNVAGAYTIRTTNSSGCTSVSNSTTLTVNVIPSATISQGSSLELNCTNGSSLSLTASVTPSGTTTYSWYSVNTSVTPNTLTLVSTASSLSVTSSGTYVVDVIVNNNGCVGRSNAITVTQSPTISSPTATEICEGQQFQLTASVADKWLFSPDNTSYTEVSAASLTYNATVTGYYKVGNSCPVQVNVRPKPLVSVSAANALICAGSSSLISSTVSTPNATNVTYQYQWLRDGALINDGTSATYTASLDGSYTLKVTNNFGCSSTSSGATIDVVNNPVLITTNPGAVCSPNKVDLTASSVIAGSTSNTTTTYWTDANGTQALANPSQVSASGTYYLKLADQNGCTSPIKPVVVAVNALPVFTVAATTTVCSPNTVDLTALVSSAQTLTYSFYADASGTALISNPTAINASGVYYAEGTNASGCSELKPMTVTINATPVISGSLTICEGATSQLSATGTPAAQTPWISSNTGIATISATGLVTGVAAGTVTITYTNSLGCSDQAVVTINPLPVITGASAALCQGSTLTLSGSGTAASSNPWVSDNLFVATVSNTGVVSGLSAGSANITFTNITGCSATYQVTVNALPALPTAQLTQPTCSVATGTITITSPTGTGLTYSIDNINYSNSLTFGNLASGNYAVTAKSADGCTSAVKTLTIDPALNAPAVPVITATGSTTICSGNNVTLNSSAAFGYQWYLDGIQIAGATSQSFTTNQAGTYTVEVRNSSGCKTLSTTPAVVVINPIPEVTIDQSSVLALSCNSSSLNLEATLSANAANATYEWYKDNVVISGATSAIYNATLPGVYRVKVTVNSCSSDSNSITVIDPPSISNVNATSTATEICQGSFYVLSASAGLNGTYQWEYRATSNDSWAPAGGSSTSSTYNASISGFYRVVLNGLSASCPAQVIVNPKPVVTITPASNLACAGNPVSISSSVPGFTATALTYSWRLNGINISSSNNAIYQASTSGTYTLRVTDAKGCSGVSAGTAITINANPILVVTEPDAICQPGTIDLTLPEITTGSNLPSGTTLSYWTDLAATSAVSDPSAISVGVNALTTYYIKATTSSGCSVISPVAVTINPRPSAAVATVTQPTCTVGTGTIAITSPTLQGLSYSIDGINYTSSATFATVNTGNYQVYVKDAAGCLSVPTSVTVNSQPPAPARPVVSSDPGDTVCEGQSITLTSSSTSGNQWYKNGVLITGANLQTLVVTQAGAYTVKVTNATGCSSAESLVRNLVFNDLPVVSLKQNTQLALSCELPSALLESEVSPSGNYTYQWFRNGVPISGATASSYNASTEGKYQVKATSASLCTSSSSELTVLPPVSSNSTLAEVCNGETITLTASAPAGYTGVTYQWQKKTGSGSYVNENLPGAQSASYLVTSGSYSTTQTNFYRVVISGTLNGSAVSSATCPTELRINALPTLTVSATNNGALCSGNLGLISATGSGSGGLIYQWSDGSDNPINGATSNKLLVSTADTYKITVTDGKGCIKSATQPITVTAAPELSITPPSPVCSPASIDLTSSEITTGSVLPNGTVLTYSATLNGSALSNPASVTTGGTYFIKATNGTCSDVAPVLVTIDPIPVLVITNPAPACATGKVNITAGSVTSGSTLPFGTTLTYWQDAAATVALADPSELAVSGTYYIKAEALSGCSDIEAVTVVVGNSNSGNIVINNPAAVCAPGSVDLTAPAITTGSTLTNASFSYWTDEDATDALINPSAVKVSGTYYIDILSGNCSEIKPVVVSITSAPAKPSITLSQSSLCPGQSTTVTAVPQTGSASDYNYAWTVPNGVTDPGNVESFSSNKVGNYSVVITSKATSCSSSAPNATAEVKASPIPVVSGTLTACIGGTTQLSGSGTPAENNAWSSSDTGVASVSVLGEVTGVSAGTATITYTNNSGCTATATVTINPFPTISGSLNVCIGGSTQLIGSGSAAGVSPWASSNTAVATITSQGVVSGLSAGTTIITYTNSNGCKSTSTLTVNALPAITGTLSTCIGGTTQLNGSGTVTSWISSNTNVATISNSGLVTGVSSGTSTIIYTNSLGCTSTASITINGTPSITGNTSVCVGQTATLTGSGLPAGNNPWLSSNSAIVSISSSGVVTGVSAGTATITYQNNNGCITTTTVTVSSLPAVTGTTALCVGQTSSLTGSGTAATSNTWASSNINVATVSASGVVTAIGAGTALVSYTNSGGCTAAAVITVSALPTITGVLNACVGGTTQLTGTGFVSSWSSSDLNVATVNSTGLVTGVAAGTATITYITSGGCQTSKTVTINAAPSVTGTLAACVGGTTQLTGTGTALGWNSDNNAVAIVSNTGLVTGISAGTATITYTNSLGCSKSVSVTVNAGPSISGTLSACVGGTSQLTGTGTASSWASSITSVATVSSTGLVTGVSSGTVTITYTNNSGCQAIATVVINDLPAISGNLSACIGSTTQLSGTGTSSGWSSSDVGIATVSNTGLVTGVAAGTAKITYTNNLGCQVSANVKVSAPPTITGSLTACAGGSTQLTGSGVSFAWNSSNSNVATVDNTGKVTGISAGTAVITYTETNGCSASVSVTINALPAISGTNTVCTGLSTILVGSGTPASSDAWISLNPSIATVNASGVVTGISSGTAVITFTNSSGCKISANVFVNQSPLISGNSAVCAGQTISLTGSGTPATQDAWVSSNIGIATVSNTGVVTGVAEGTATITYKNSVGCSVTKAITVNALPQAPRSITGPILIEKNSTNTYQVADVPDASKYQWTLPTGWTGSSTTSSISVTSNSNGGTIRVRAITSAGCEGPEATLAIQIRALEIIAKNDDFSSKPIYGKDGGSLGSIFDNDTFDGQPIKGSILSKVTPSIVDNGGIGGLIIDATGNLIIPPGANPGVYQITYKICETDKPTNCSQAVITIDILDNKINVPEGISPQGDGKNDKWLIKGLDAYPNHKLAVYNRWGNIVYQAAPYKNDWDGRSQNSLTLNGDDRLPAGTYYWVIELGDGSRLAGYVYIAY